MRAYELMIDGKVVETTKGNPYALQVKFDFVLSAAFAALQHEIEIRNVLPRYLSQERNLVGLPVRFSAGMQKGFPLAKPGQYGIIFTGTIQRAIKIVEGVETKLILLVRSAGVDDAGPVFSVKAGQNIVSAIKTAMSTVNIAATFDPGLGSILATHDDKAALANLSDLSALVGKYGILMYPYAGGVRFAKKSSGDTTAPIITIEANDLIGQPVATDTSTIVLQTTLRGDIVPFQQVKIPSVRINPASGFAELTNISQTGIYTVTELRHCGDYRNMAADSWVTQLTVLRAE